MINYFLEHTFYFSNFQKIICPLDKDYKTIICLGKG